MKAIYLYSNSSYHYFTINNTFYGFGSLFTKTAQASKIRQIGISFVSNDDLIEETGLTYNDMKNIIREIRDNEALLYNFEGVDMYDECKRMDNERLIQIFDNLLNNE